MGSLPELTDEEVALRVQKGDVESFSALIDRYEPKLSRYAKKFLLDPDDAQDLVQEVFIKAYVNLQSFDTAKRFSPWIYRIAHNEFINAIKKKTRTPILNFFDPDMLLPHPVAPESPDRDAEAKELKKAFDTSLDSLDVKYREPLILYYLEEMDYKEIADILKVPVSTVGVRLKRGRYLLKRAMEPHA